MNNKRNARSGAVLVWFALMLTMLLGMLGLVIDTGLLMSAQRHAQNAADAAALAAANDLMMGRSKDDAINTAITFVNTHNDLSDAPPPTVNIPPASGPYAGLDNYVEVIVASPRQTYFIQILSADLQDQTVSARAVAGFESVSAGEGVAVLDPTARPGLGVGGTAVLKVHGRVYDNSEGGGLDEDGLPVDNGNSQYSGQVSNNALLMATDIRTVGGVNIPDNFQPYDPDSTSNVLHAKELPIPDPLVNLPTPTTTNGVNSAYRGAPQATNVNLKLNDTDADDVNPKNYVDQSDPDPANHEMILYPGIYTSIEITGGNVTLTPGIYVLRPDSSTQNVLKITGGNVTVDEIMFYATGDNYNPVSGEPDMYDGNDPPPTGYEKGVQFGAITINAGMRFTPLDNPSSPFHNMLFYQRRWNTQSVDFQGDAEDGDLSGTLYAKWAKFKIAGQGIYNAQFVVGSLQLTGQGDVTIDYQGTKLGKAPRVFLVE